MERKLSPLEIICVLIGLVGVILLWLNIDRGGWILYFSFLIIATQKVTLYFGLNPYERNRTEITKVVLSALMIMCIVTHIIWAGKPLFGLLIALLLLQSITNLEPQKKDIPERF
ncbi:MAG TPA: hypothetical protein VFE57_06870 [Cyclobacteriaceae bacterium]|jgi:drug/metabolite transporter (DMT)-like permease|nr:hypothetical protein [Cyclobacteriaceae bacterium]